MGAWETKMFLYTKGKKHVNQIIKSLKQRNLKAVRENSPITYKKTFMGLQVDFFFQQKDGKHRLLGQISAS